MQSSEDNLVLIIEDEIEISNVLAEIIEEMGLCVHHCYNGREALDLLVDKKINPVLVICDIAMPEMSGIEFVKFQLAKNLNLNICMLTSNVSSEAITQALQLGVTDYISKPPDINELKDKITRLVEFGQSKARLQQIGAGTPEVDQINKEQNMFRLINSTKKPSE